MRLSIIIGLGFLVGCSGSDGFAIGAAGGDTGPDTAAEAEPDGGVPETLETPDASETGAPDGGGLDSEAPEIATDTGMPPTDTGVTDTAIEAACLDKDGDGETDIACGGTDCHDGNKDVFSKQTAYFLVAYTTTSGAKSFDYNCSGKEDPRWPARGAVCTMVGTTCTLTTEGWKGTSGAIPACGGIDDWVLACAKTTSGCIVGSYVARNNDCR